MIIRWRRRGERRMLNVVVITIIIIIELTNFSRGVGWWCAADDPEAANMTVWMYSTVHPIIIHTTTDKQESIFRDTLFWELQWDARSTYYYVTKLQIVTGEEFWWGPDRDTEIGSLAVLASARQQRCGGYGDGGSSGRSDIGKRE